uniref:Uncharacterized protein n=1 Tax=Pyxicephalus adspersus TaxID=30357 RepID=A0AAV2ZZS7_PYXAD|nr:TPA: hypothetical protein GDO54_002410 [Pyxicephalus adspersus]
MSLQVKLSVRIKQGAGRARAHATTGHVPFYCTLGVFWGIRNPAVPRLGCWLRNVSYSLNVISQSSPWCAMDLNRHCNTARC